MSNDSTIITCTTIRRFCSLPFPLQQTTKISNNSDDYGDDDDADDDDDDNDDNNNTETSIATGLRILQSVLRVVV